ncbi:PKD domain-containing protein [Tamlana sp. 2_MG-2023]|uniref:PKD domain-containing protein n=1 Tax=unclassified Tamlana TaxID=2614803 RepID=UPI0026E127E1|nr:MULTISPECIES: PKD domain-containing protein [unclassified Tamlana]MDO6759893.1 PKD domain-containing protein [Tamlana sp. 2_MG-2023]MDO6791937.1 PKD domain-containing protein [Tamlana sp. 1_MG-2023]
MNKPLLFICCALICIYSYGQNLVTNDSLTRAATIKNTTTGNAVIFTPETPALNQIAGAPKAFYTYFWEFGDGHYSKEENPKHIYKNKGEYEVKLWATNNYDTGKPPTSRPKKVAINNLTTAYEDMASMEENFTLKRNREPIPSEDIVAIMSYKNTKTYPTNGKLYLFYNEHKFKANNFELIETRTHHNEKRIPTETFAYTQTTDDNSNYLASVNDELFKTNEILQDSTVKTNLPLTISESKSYYKDWSILEFDNMEPEEERHIFFSLKTTPEMVKDTSAIISIRGIYVPDDNYDNHNIKDMEMEIVTSHDPNNMSSNATIMNYRLVRFKTLKYKIKFQNNGEGPANTIRLETDVPDMLDKSTIEVVDMYPKCDICPKREVLYSCLDTTFTDSQAIFTFKNIYLPGSEQKNVKEYDSTKGFVKYKIKFAKDFHKQKTKSRTAIIFDKNDPIITNYSTTRFLPGLSIGAKVGYNWYSDLQNSESYFFGATLSPYKSYRWYWQVELMNNFHNYDANITVSEAVIDGAQGFRFLQRTTTNTSYENIDWDVPVLIRYNVNNYIGLGTGLNTTISVSEKQNQSVLIEQFEGQNPDAPIFNTIEESNTQTESFTNLRAGVLFEATAGFARIGPSLGARYVLNFKNDFNYWQFYAIWKF